MCNFPAKQSPQNRTASWVFHFRQNGHKFEMLKRVAIITNNGVRLQNLSMLTSKQTLILFLKVFSKHAIQTFICQMSSTYSYKHEHIFWDFMSNNWTRKANQHIADTRVWMDCVTWTISILSVIKDSSICCINTQTGLYKNTRDEPIQGHLTTHRHHDHQHTPSKWQKIHQNPPPAHPSYTTTPSWRIICT